LHETQVAGEIDAIEAASEELLMLDEVDKAVREHGVPSQPIVPASGEDRQDAAD
jgi:hypothetical protein